VDDVSFDIENNKNAPLSSLQLKALRRLLALKRLKDEIGRERFMGHREREIDKFLRDNNLKTDTNVMNVVKDAYNEVSSMDNLENRYRRLNNRPVTTSSANYDDFVSYQDELTDDAFKETGSILEKREKLKESITNKTLQNRINSLRGQPKVELTAEERVYFDAHPDEFKGGIRKTRRKKCRKTKKRRSNRKMRHRKSYRR